jgi:mannosidase alpha-like ER degradation enhancer 2
MCNGTTRRHKLCAAVLILAGSVSPGGALAEPDAAAIHRAKLAARVKAEFKHAWAGYKKYAWGHDALKPLSKAPQDWYAEPLLLTPLSALDTSRLMGLEAEYEEAKSLVMERLSFDKNMEVQVFEISIRHLGSLLGAYELDRDKRYLELATDLADRLMPAFDSPTGMPYRYVNLRTGKTREARSNPAEIGTYLVEWGTLARLTGRREFYEKPKKAVQALYQRRSRIGLVGMVIDVQTGEWLNTSSHIGGMIDAYYEYLLKSWLMFGDDDFKVMWDESIRAVNAHVAEEMAGRLWYGQVDMHTGQRTGHHFGSLDAFMPAVLVLGGDVGRAARLQDSCYAMWTLHGIEPETLDYAKMEASNEGYLLRPEIIESAYYLYYFTQDPKYLEMGREFLEGLIEHCRCEAGYAHLASVQTKEQHDAMEAFFLSETLKYLYLIFAPLDTLDLSRNVLSTEAHPLRKWTTHDGSRGSRR